MCALDAMHHTKRSRAFVVNTRGEAVGVVTLLDICRELVTLESQLKIARFDRAVKEEKNADKRAGIDFTLNFKL